MAAWLTKPHPPLSLNVALSLIGILIMKPAPKSKSLNQLLNGVFNREACITHDVCVDCGESAEDFRDALSIKEFSLSGLCQICQDSVFGTEEPF